MMMNKAVFLDRDGVINYDPSYINNCSQFSIYPYVGKAIAILNKLGFKVIVVTNQSGIARGYLSIDMLESIHQKLKDEIKQDNAFIDKIYYSPYHIKGIIKPYNIDHEDRKPDIGMFKKAQKEFNLDPTQSFMIGDRASDMVFAYRAKLKPILVLSGDGKKDLLQKEELHNEYAPLYIAQDLLAASLLIESMIKD